MMEHLEHYPEILLDLLAKIDALLDHDEAAFAIVERIRLDWSGANRYFSKGRRKAPAAAVPSEQQALFGDAPPQPADPALPELIERLRRDAEQILVDKGLTAEKAAEVAALVHGELLGEQFYVPKGQAFELARRDQEIYRRFSSATIDILCRRYGLTRQRVYQINAEQVKQRQLRLPLARAQGN